MANNDYNSNLNSLFESLEKTKNLMEQNNATIFNVFSLFKDFENNLKSFVNNTNKLNNEIKDSTENTKKIHETKNKTELDTLKQQRETYLQQLEINRDNKKAAEYIKGQIEDITNNIKRKELEDRILSQPDGEEKLKTLKTNEEVLKNIRDFLSKQEKEANEAIEKSKNNVLASISNLVKNVIETFNNSAKKVSQEYENVAGNMSAALNSTVSDIHKLQKNIAENLRDNSLREAISNIKVLQEANNLVSSGYTNADKLEESALGLSIAKEIAPNLDLNNNTVKNLTNIFGTDFISRFSAIQAAVQDTAGSTINISSNVSKMLNSLEPVFENAQYENLATQDMSDIQATISAAIDNNKINQSEADELMNMMVELMDPSKAFKSNNVSVRVAATNYDFGSGSPLQALQALLNARETAYSNVSMSNDYWGNISRSLVASAFGDNTMNATYMPQGLYGLDILHTDNLNDVYNNQYNKLQNNDFTTRKEREENWVSNNSVTQKMASFYDEFPIFGATIINLLSSIAYGSIAKGSISKVLDDKFGDFFKLLTNGTTEGGTTNTNVSVGTEIINNSTTNITNGRTLKSMLTTPTNLTKMFGVGIGAGLTFDGITDIVDLYKNNDNNVFDTNNSGQVYNSLAKTFGGVGATFGTFLGGPVGTVVGGALGGLTGALVAFGGLVDERKKQEEEANKLREEQLSQTKKLLGDGIQLVESDNLASIINNGGGVAHLQSGDYAIDMTMPKYPGFAMGLDYVPYDDYIVRLHKGEAVLTADVAEKQRKANPNFYNMSMNEDSNLVGAIKEQTESIVGAVRGDKEYQPLTQNMPKSYTINNI